MDIQIRTIEPGEYDAWAVPITAAFGGKPGEEWAEIERRLLEFDRTIAALDGDRFVGTSSTYSLDLTVPGGQIPMAGVTMVAVSPTHRRRGINAELMRRTLEDVRELGREPLVGLWASESSIYGRFGYGAATLSGAIEIPRRAAGFRSPAGERGRLSFVEDHLEALAVFGRIYDEHRRTRVGLVSRPTMPHWEWRFIDVEDARDGAGPYFHLLHEGPEGPDGYALYRVKQSWDDGFPNGSVEASEVVALNPAAAEAIWRHLLDVDLTARTEWWGCPMDLELRHMLADPRQMRWRVQDGLWLRPSDVPRMLGARTYVVDGRIAIGVRDKVCPWVDGSYVLEGGPDGAECRRDDRATADLVVGAAELGSIFLGGIGLGSLARAGLVDEETVGALELAHAMFGAPSAPWCSGFF